MTALRRVLLINPNTTAAITEKVAAEAGPLLGDGIEAVAVTGRFGARYVASRAAFAIAAHAALDAYAEHGEGSAGVLLACFGDPGLEAVRELADVPVVGLAEASLHAACQVGARVGIVTGGERWGPMLREFVASRGLSSRLAGIRTVAPSGAEIARDPDAALSLLADAVARLAAEDGAEAVILGGAGLVGLAHRVQPLAGVPVLCSVRCGVAALIAQLALAPTKPSSGSYAATPPVDSTGLSPALAARLNGSRA